MLFNCGIKFGVSPRLISLRLLSDLDKDDMLRGIVEIVELETAVEIWRDNGMPDYAHGKTIPYHTEKQRINYKKLTETTHKELYRKPFVEYRAGDKNQ